jgi:hypothetical protein
MPIQECNLKNGNKGWKYGKSGKCYASRKSAERQQKAIHASGYKGRTRRSS